MAEKAYGLLINYEYCTGCMSCEMACSVEHDIPVGQYGIKMATCATCALGALPRARSLRA